MIDNFDYKIVLGLVAVGMSFIAHVPYLVSALRKNIKPHIFTWILWTFLTFIIFAAQIVSGGGAGAWVTGVTGLMCVFITLAAWRNSEKDITKADWLMFLAGLSAIPFWLMTDDPLSAVVIVTAVDVLAIGPTFRKSWNRPHEENSFMYGFNILRHGVSLFALQTFSWVTALFPATILIVNVCMYTMLIFRRKQLRIKDLR